MKNRIISISLLLCLANSLFAQTKHALIVAIGNYPEPRKNRWPVINSLNDIPLIKNALLTSQRFEEKNIHVLTDSQATKQGIINALDNLIAEANTGDIVLIHFSSHGQQIEDDNSDELDRLDEAIVPYGAVFNVDPAKFSQYAAGYLRDDLFGEKVTQLRNKLSRSGDLLVLIDACHSGSGTRGVETAQVRGGNIPMVSSNFSVQPQSLADSAGVFQESTATKLSSNAATYVVISGAQAKENNYECYDDNRRPVGSLSYSFSKAISSLKGTISYRGLFALVENVMLEKAPKQKPVLEGDGVDRELFGGKYEKQQPYFTINRLLSNKGQVVLNAGFVAGVTEGSTIHFFPPGTTSSVGKSPVNKGRVTSVTAFTAIVQPDSVAGQLINLNAWAFINELSYGAEKLKLFITGSKAKMIQDSLKNFLLVEINKNCELVLDTSGSINTYALKYPNSNTLFEAGFIFPRDMNRLKESLKRYDRLRYLKGLSFNEEDISATVELLFLDATGNADSNLLQSRTHFGRLELKENDRVFLRLVNTGLKQCYINIVDIQPDGIINPIMPNKNLRNKTGNPDPLKWEDCLLRQNDTMLLRNYPIVIQKPFGEETFKVFLSASPLDLEDILTTKDADAPKNKRGVLNGLEKIFDSAQVNESGTRGGIGTRVNTDQNGTVFSLNFQIVPGK